MVRLDKNGYIERRTGSGKPQGARSTYRNWFLVKWRGKYSAIVTFGKISCVVPKRYLGKRVRFKIELMEGK